MNDIMKHEQPEITDDSDDLAISRIRQQIAVQETIIRTTRPSHWEVFQGKTPTVRLNRKGAEWLARLGNVTLETLNHQKTELNDGHYMYSTTIRAILPNGRALDYTGSCDSYDKFFGTNNDKKNNDGRVIKSLLSVDENNISRKAQANAIGNAVGRLFGVHNIPVSEFAEITGFDPPGIEFRGSEAQTKQAATPALDALKRRVIGAVEATRGLHNNPWQHYATSKGGDHLTPDRIRQMRGTAKQIKWLTMIAERAEADADKQPEPITADDINFQ